MATQKTQALFVHGVQKTGTSTIVGMLNSHPQVFLFYETRMDRSQISNYGSQFLDQYPDARKFFGNCLDIGKPYLNLARYLTQNNPSTKYRYIGDKVIHLDPQLTQHVVPYKVIYAIRDVRTWLCKEQIIKNYRTDLDIVPPAIDFLRYVIKSFQSEHAMHIRLEDLIAYNDRVFSQLSSFLDLDFSQYAGHWWETVGKYDKDDPKSYIKWFAGHASSKVKPMKVDIVVKTRSHPFWEEFLPLFDKYYYANIETDFSKCMNDDLSKAETLLKYSPLPLEQCYKDILTQTPAPSLAAKRSIVERLKRRVIKALQ